jgi:hypothetical protein
LEVALALGAIICAVVYNAISAPEKAQRARLEREEIHRIEAYLPSLQKRATSDKFQSITVLRAPTPTIAEFEAEAGPPDFVDRLGGYARFQYCCGYTYFFAEGRLSTLIHDDGAEMIKRTTTEESRSWWQSEPSHR